MFSIQTAAQLTDLTPDVIRIWERRYRAVTPERQSNGRRLFSKHDIVRLILLREATERGESISKIAALPTQELQGLTGGGSVAALDDTAAVDRLLEHVVGYEPERLAGDLLKLAGTRTPVEFCDNIVGPLMRYVGDGWAEQRLNVVQEHMVSSILRTTLGYLATQFARSKRRRAIFTTLPGERHGLGALMASYVAAEAGLQSLYVDPELPVDDVAAVAEELRPVGIGISVVMPTDEANAYLARIAERVRGPELWLGGAAAASADRWRLMPSLTEFSNALRFIR